MTQKKRDPADKKEDDQPLFVERPPLNPGYKLLTIIRKNIQLLIRARVSALIFILGPLLITALAALAFNTSTLFDLKEAMGIIKGIDRNLILVLQGASQPKKIGSDISPTPAKLIDFWDAAKRELRDVRVIPQVHKILKVR